MSNSFWLKCVLSSEADTDGVVISPAGRGVDYKPAENQVNVWICSQLLSTSNSWPSERPRCCFPIRNQSLSRLTESQQSTTRRYEAAVLHLQLWIDTSLKGLISNLQSFTSELLQPLVQSVCRGFKGALLLCGVSTPKIHNLVEARVIKQVNPHSHTWFWHSVIFLIWTFVLGLDRSVWWCGVSGERWLVHLWVLPAGDYNRMYRKTASLILCDLLRYTGWNDLTCSKIFQLMCRFCSSRSVFSWRRCCGSPAPPQTDSETCDTPRSWKVPPE